MSGELYCYHSFIKCNPLTAQYANRVYQANRRFAMNIKQSSLMSGFSLARRILFLPAFSYN